MVIFAFYVFNYLCQSHNLNQNSYNLSTQHDKHFNLHNHSGITNAKLTFAMAVMGVELNTYFVTKLHRTECTDIHS